MDQVALIKMFGAFFAIMNPFVNLPIFLSMTDGFSVAQQRMLAVKVSLFCAIMGLVILVAGQKIIGFFGISIDDFRIAGGLVLGHIAWSMLNGSEAASHHGSSHEKQTADSLDSMAFYPLTFPMIIGPGTIATLIIYAGHSNQLSHLFYVGGVLLVILSILFVVLFFASLFGNVLTATMRVIMTRLMGMILLAIAVEMVVTGVKVLLPGLAA